MITRAGRHRLLKRFTARCATCAVAGMIGWPPSGLAQPADQSRLDPPASPQAVTASSATTSPALSLTQQATEHANLVEQYSERIADIQSEYGPYDERLIAPLENLTRVLLEAGNHEDALTALEQQLQVYRVNDGLYTARQIPVIETRLKTYAETGDWARLSDTLGYLSWVYQRDTTLPIDRQLSGLKELGNWHLTAMGHDSREREAFHLVQLREIESNAADLAELHYGADSEAVVPFLYDQSLADIYIALAIMLTTDTSQDLMLQTEGIRGPTSFRPSPGYYPSGRVDLMEIEAMYGSKVSTVIERTFKNRISMSQAQLERIREIHALNGNPEGEGMALMNLGDVILLRQQYERQPGKFAGMRRGTSNPGPAMGYYGKALAAFREAGLPEQMVTTHTRCPVLLPITSFSTRLQDALVNCGQADESGVTDLGSYDLISTLIPGLEGDVASVDSLMSATIRFDIRTNGQINGLNIIEITPDNTPNRVRIRKLAELLQFRPAIPDGKAQRTENAQLIVRMPAASDEE